MAANGVQLARPRPYKVKRVECTRPTIGINGSHLQIARRYGNSESHPVTRDAAIQVTSPLRTKRSIPTAMNRKPGTNVRLKPKLAANRPERTTPAVELRKRAANRYPACASLRLTTTAPPAPAAPTPGARRHPSQRESEINKDCRKLWPVSSHISPSAVHSVTNSGVYTMEPRTCSSQPLILPFPAPTQERMPVPRRGQRYSLTSRRKLLRI